MMIGLERMRSSCITRIQVVIVLFIDIQCRPVLILSLVNLKEKWQVDGRFPFLFRAPRVGHIPSTRLCFLNTDGMCRA